MLSIKPICRSIDFPHVVTTDRLLRFCIKFGNCLFLFTFKYFITMHLPQQRPHHDIAAMFAEAQSDFVRVSAPSKS